MASKSERMNSDPLNGLRQWLGGLPQWLTFSFSNDHIWFPQLRSRPCPCIETSLNIEAMWAAVMLLLYECAVANNPDNPIKMTFLAFFNRFSRPSLNWRVGSIISPAWLPGCGTEVSLKRKSRLFSTQTEVQVHSSDVCDLIYPGCLMTDRLTSEISSWGGRCTVTLSLFY